MKAVGIDIGTTSVCGAVLDAESGDLIGSLTLPNDSFIKSDAEFEKIQDVAEIMKTVLNLLDSLDAASADAIGFSGQMHGIVYADENLNAVSPLYTWKDERAAAEYKDGASYARVAGCFPGYGLATDFYNEVNGLIPDNAAVFCPVADYAVARLCGLKRPLVHITDAASLGGFDVLENRFGVKNPRLPETSDKFEIAGRFRGVPVCVAVGDNQASFIGSASRPDDVLINVGTGSQVSWLVDDVKKVKNAEIRPFDGERYLAAGCALCGGEAFADLERFFRRVVFLATGKESGSLYSRLDAALEDKLSTSLKADCRFCGTRSDPDARGSFSNISEENFTPADFALATVEGIAAELYGMCESENIGGLVCSGNGVRKNAALREAIRRKFGVPPRFPLYPEEASYGAALTACVAAGRFENISRARELIKYMEAD